MAQFPALPLFTDAYMADTRHLNAAQHGAYLLLLMTAWRMLDCKLPNDDKFLARCASTDLRVWKASTKDAVMSFWKLDEQGKWYQERLLDERKYVQDKSSKNAAAANNRWLKNKETDDADALPKPCQNDAPTPTPTVEGSLHSPSTPISPKANAHLMTFTLEDGMYRLDGFFEKLWLMYPKIRDRGHKGKAKEELIKKLNKGDDYEVIIRSVAKYGSYCQATGEPNRDFFRWLRDADYENRDYDSTAKVRAAGGQPASNETSREQRQRALAKAAEELGLIEPGDVAAPEFS